MSVAKKLAGITQEEYLAGERDGEVRHEYINGDVYAMAGAKLEHNQITGNVSRAFGNHLEGSPCQPFSSDMKVQVENNYYYPDVLVDCSALERGSVSTETPVIIVEVLSESTRYQDRTHKKFAYLSLPTLQEYVLIEPDFVDIEVCRRSSNWGSTHYYLGDAVTFESIDLILSVEEIYYRVQNDDMVSFLEKQAESTQ